MRFNSRRLLYSLSLLCLVAAVWFWLKGNEGAAKRKAARGPTEAQKAGDPPGTNVQRSAGGAAPATLQPATSAPSAAGAGATGVGGAPANQLAAVPPSRFPYRLSNTDGSLSRLGRSDTAILLDNAFIDTAIARPLVVPEHLRAKGEPGSYIVQSRDPLDGEFYARLREAGAEFVSYVPNNAGLVRVSAEGARQLAGISGIRAVLPYEPYYKFAQALLPLAVEQQSLPLDRPLNVTLFPGERDKAVSALRDLGAEVIREDRTPFGPMLTINPHPDSLAALAQLPEVQRIEYAGRRVVLNDLSRVRTGVSADTVTNGNYLGLTGTNVMLNINDTGVDASHPDLSGRVFSTDTNAFTLLDTNGHGTHVAGTIISSGGQSATVLDRGNPPSGSVAGASYRGMAPGASLFVLPIDLRLGPLISDTYLQETAAATNFVGAGRTNAIISNNSWAYDGTDYNSASASYDAAVRDALPGLTGSQPVLYVFAAGNSGFGTTNGAIGHPDSISAPATAKNVITVGAVESFRNITNEFYTTNVVSGTNVIVTNTPFLGFTDSDNEVAFFSSRGNVGIGTEGDFGRFKPDVVAPGTFIVSTRSGNMDTNNLDPLVPDLGANYRYESGTSMSAPNVSGVLALMQEFFEQQLKRGISPALLKALLINGARSVNPNYDLSVTNAINFQGWGLVNLTNSLPAALMSATDETTWPIRFFDQSPTDAIATGERHTWNLSLSTDARSVPLRATLVWTDPPGNPGAGIKLVNDLDLIVTNLDTGDVFVGNNIPTSFDFNQPSTNTPPDFDFVNNVENVFLEPPLGTNYSITVTGRRVNVNAVTANITDVVQDYALVVASGDGDLTNAFVSLTRASDDLVPRLALVGLTNGMPLLKQRVGANFQLVSSPDGETNQWRFYVFTNAFFTNNFTGLTNGSNVAFITFLPPDLSRARNLDDADIDLYVSNDPALTNLDAGAISNAWKSLNRGGTESVVFTNAAVSVTNIYYIGVKSEDQQGAEFGIVALSTDTPFDEAGDNGSRILHGMPPSVQIADGSPDSPGAALMFAVGIRPESIARVIVTNDITHQSIGDLVGSLSHQYRVAVLNNHNRFDGTTNTFFHLVYDDSGGGQYFFTRPTDGPGKLNNFVGEQSSGVWLLTMIDDTHTRTGRVDGLTLRVEPQQSLFDTNGVAGSVLANQWVYYFVDVPVDGSKLTVTLSQVSGPLNLYVRRGAPPTTTDFDKSALIDPPGGELSVGLGDVPPLNAGRYFIGIFNPNAFTVTFRIRANIERNLASVAAETYLPTNALTLKDDAISGASLVVTNNRPVSDVQVAVRIDHARASDLVLHLVSPQGTRVLLAENRGSVSPLGYGISYTVTNVYPQTSSGGPEEDRRVIETGQNTGTVKLSYDFFQIPDTLHIYYEGVLIFDTGLTNGTGSISIKYGPGSSTQVTIVVNEGGSSNRTTAWNYTAAIVTEQIIYTFFTENTNLTTTPIKFGPPPFGTTSGFATNLVYTNSFEGTNVGDYCAVTNLGPWQLYSNHVTVVSNVLQSHTGTNYLELVNGQVLLDLPTIAGRQYLLRNVYRRSPPDPSLVSWWPGEGNANDIVSTNNGMVTNGLTFSDGMVGRAFSFDGDTNKYVLVPASSDLAVTNFTVEGWIYPTNLSIALPVFEYSQPTGWAGVHLWINHVSFVGDVPGVLYANVRDITGPGGRTINSAPGVIRSNQWQHVALTYNSVSGDTKLYVDGNVVATANYGGAIPQTTYPIYIGHRPAGSLDSPSPGGRTFQGGIDEIGLFSRVLSQVEIRAIYLAQHAGKCGAQTFPFATPISWWPAERDYNDIIDGNNGTPSVPVPFVGGVVGQAFQLTNFDSSIIIGNPTNLQLQNFSIEAWIQRSDTNRVSLDPGPQGGSILSYGSGGYVFFLSENGNLALGSVDLSQVTNTCAITDLLPHHVAVTKGDSNVVFYVDGQMCGQTNFSDVFKFTSPVAIGARPDVFRYAFYGSIDEAAIYDRPLDACEIGAIYQSNVRGKYTLLGRPAPCEVSADIVIDERQTRALLSTNWQAWQTNEMTFTATQNGTPLRLVGHEPEMWFDTFELSEITAPNYFLPEETLRTLIGQSALGTWKLEVWDDRVGAFINPTPQLLTWELQFTFANTNPPAIPLTFCPATTNVASVYSTNCVPVTNIVTGSEVRYFIVDVPRRATMATNTLTSATGDLVLLFNQDGLPTGNPVNGDVIIDTNGGVGDEVFLLATNGLPPNLKPGQRYYLGVSNAVPTETNAFTISVAFDRTDTNLISVPALTNGLCYSNTIPVTNALDYYQFTVSTNASAVTFQLTPQNGNADLVVRRALPVPDPLPSPVAGRYDYISQNPGTNVDEIIVATNSQPVALSPGLWYLGVFNMDTNPVSYSICATESGGPIYNIVRLTNDVPLDFTIGAGSQFTNFFLFTIDQTNAAVSFWLYNLNNPADLLVDLNRLPDQIAPLFSSPGSSNNPVQIVVDTNVSFADLNGDWYLAANNQSTNDLSFTILATFSTNGVPTNNIVIDPQLIVTNGTICLTWSSVIGQNYYVEAKTNLNDLTWTVVSPTITATNATTTYCVPITGPQMFFRVSQGTAASSPTINFTSLTMTPGGFVLNWTAPAADRFQVQYATNLPPVWITFTNTVVTSTNGNFTFTDDGSQSGGLSALRYYRLILLP